MGPRDESVYKSVMERNNAASDLSKLPPAPGCKARMQRICKGILFGLSNSHLYVSVLHRAPLVPFAYRERLTCLITLLYTSLMVSALFFGQKQSLAGSIGKSVICSVIAVIVGILRCAILIHLSTHSHHFSCLFVRSFMQSYIHSFILSARLFAVAPQAERVAVESEMRAAMMAGGLDDQPKHSKPTGCFQKICTGLVTALIFAFLPPPLRRTLKQVCKLLIKLAVVCCKEKRKNLKSVHAAKPVINANRATSTRGVGGGSKSAVALVAIKRDVAKEGGNELPNAVLPPPPRPPQVQPLDASDNNSTSSALLTKGKEAKRDSLTAADVEATMADAPHGGGLKRRMGYLY